LAAVLTGRNLYSLRLFTPHRFSFTLVGEAGVEPAYPSLIRRVPSPFGHSPVGKPGVEPGDYSLIRGAPSPVGYLPKAEDEGVEPHGRYGRHWCSKPVAAPAAHLPLRRAAGTIRSGHPPARFRDGACHPAGSLSTSAPRSPVMRTPGTGGWRKTVETIHMAFGHHPLSRRGSPPGDFIFRAEEGGRLERHGFPRASASNGARHACPVHLPYAGRDLHPHAPSGTQVPGTCASAFRHQRIGLSRGRALDPFRLPTANRERLFRCLC
jgi:hypothetical protein